MTDTDVTVTDVTPFVNPMPDFPEPQLPVSGDAPDPAALVAAEQAAIAEVVTLVQPVPVHTDNPAGEIEFTSELWWYTGTDVVGTGPTPPASGAPTLTAINPASGPAAGGTVVTITGTGFTGATLVAFGATAAASFTVDSDTQITATTAPYAYATPAPMDVTVMTPQGNATSGPEDWTYTA